MTSSLPEETPKKEKVPGWRQPWDAWRIMMFTGSLVMLAVAFSRAGGETRLPGWLSTGLFVLGYGLLGIGFFLAMRMRRDIKEKRAATEKKNASRRDPGRST